jgi:ABC-type cobalamin/Fe3+-siderophores transport system ATPase subunit
MISQIVLKFGRAPGLPVETIQATPVTVFVGPNFSGKSKILTEILQFCSSGQRSLGNVILDSITFHGFSAADAPGQIAKVQLKPQPSELQTPGSIFVGKRGNRHQVPEQNLLRALENPNENSNWYCVWYLSYNTLMLDGKNRINLVNEQPAGDLQQAPHASLQALFRDDATRTEVRRIIFDAFGLYFVIDPTHLGHLRIRLANRPPATLEEERGIHSEAVTFHGEALPIEQASDGVKAFTEIITELYAGDPRILLLDEPEAFLHPSLAFNLGKEVAHATVGSDKRLFVSTHSPNFVMGCIQSGTPVNIVRLTYRGGVSTARILPNT